MEANKSYREIRAPRRASLCHHLRADMPSKICIAPTEPSPWWQQRLQQGQFIILTMRSMEQNVQSLWLTRWSRLSIDCKVGVIFTSSSCQMLKCPWARHWTSAKHWTEPCALSTKVGKWNIISAVQYIIYLADIYVLPLALEARDTDVVVVVVVNCHWKGFIYSVSSKTLLQLLLGPDF